MSKPIPKIIRSVDDIPPGSVRIHLYNWRDVMRPRGSMRKESLGQLLLERFKSCFEDWTDPEYGDNPDVLELANTIYQNTLDEVYRAWNEFIHNGPQVKVLADAVKKRREGDHVGQTDSADGTKGL